MDPYATHIPVIAAAAHWSGIEASELPILELGCGDYSTPLLFAMRGDRPLHIVSSDPEWSDKYADIAHMLTLLKSKDEWQQWKPSQRYSMALLDNEQLVVHRIQLIPRLLKMCNIVVMHDWRDGLPMNLNHVGHNWGIYKRWEPWTMWVTSETIGQKTPFHI